MIQRTECLKTLALWQDKNVIKVITGIRRCGKSTLLEQFQEQLRKNGVEDAQILSLNFEKLDYEDLLDYRALYRYVMNRLQEGKTTYVFLDEVQLVPDFQKAVDSLYIQNNVDLYITGSNAWLLSGELATLLSGRYVEINLLPFSFVEYCRARAASGDAALAEYMRWGGFPYIASLDKVPEQADTYLEGIYNTIIVKDIDLRQRRREYDPNKRKVTDITLLKNISRFLAGSVGSPVSDKSIADYITSSGRKVSQSTISDYVEALVEPYIFYPVQRFDVSGKQLLKQNRKLYIADLGLRHHLLARREYDLGYSLENVVYFELLRRGYRVNVGKLGQREIDFVAEKNSRTVYVQVTASMTDAAVFEREMAPLRAIRDNYPKIVLTLDRFTVGNYEGIEVINAVDWLMEKYD